MPPAGLGLAEPALCSQPTIWPRGGEKLSDGSLITWWPTGLWGLGEVWAGEPTGPVQGRGTLQAASPSTSPPSLQCPTTIWVHRCPQRTPPPRLLSLCSWMHGHQGLPRSQLLGRQERPVGFAGRNKLDSCWDLAGTVLGPASTPPPATGHPILSGAQPDVCVAAAHHGL